MIKPILSVVINCFNRRDYVMDALKSVCSQTLSRSEYEIILIRNFHDEEIDIFAEANEITDIYTDKVTTGSWFEIAANKANGDFISFLDDDDVIRSDKLNIIKSIFQRDSRIGYIHNKLVRSDYNFLTTQFDTNKIVYIKTDNERGLRSALKKRYYSNLSSISIKHELLTNYMTFIRNTSHATDFVIFSAACMSGVRMVEYDDPLTFFRVHSDSRSNFTARNISELENEKSRVLPDYINNWSIISEFQSESPLKEYSKSRLLTTKIWLNIVSPDPVYHIGFTEIIASIRGIGLYPLFIPFLFVYYFDRLFHRATKKIYYMIIYSWLGWRLRENI